MRTIDTNILVRAIVRDDIQSSETAQALLSSTERVHIPIIVLCELVWVLGSRYGFARLQIADVLRTLIDGANIRIDRDRALSGLGFLEKGGDFADGIILDESRRADADCVMTFDREFVRLGMPDVVLVK